LPALRLFSLIEVIEVLLQEVIEEGPYHADGCELSDVGPGRCDGGAHDVGGEFKFKSQQEPNPEAQPASLRKPDLERPLVTAMAAPTSASIAP
jgi:hypothetical protein